MRVETFFPKPLEQQKGLHMETLVESVWNPRPPQNPLKKCCLPFWCMGCRFLFGGVMAGLSHAVVSFQKCRVALEHRREWIIVGWISPGWFFPLFIGSFSESKKNRTSRLEGQKKRSAQPSDVLTSSRLFFLLLNLPRLLQNSKVKNLDWGKQNGFSGSS